MSNQIRNLKQISSNRCSCEIIGDNNVSYLFSIVGGNRGEITVRYAAAITADLVASLQHTGAGSLSSVTIKDSGLSLQLCPHEEDERVLSLNIVPTMLLKEDYPQIAYTASDSLVLLVTYKSRSIVFYDVYNTENLSHNFFLDKEEAIARFKVEYAGGRTHCF